MTMSMLVDRHIRHVPPFSISSSSTVRLRSSSTFTLRLGIGLILAIVPPLLLMSIVHTAAAVKIKIDTPSRAEFVNNMERLVSIGLQRMASATPIANVDMFFKRDDGAVDDGLRLLFGDDSRHRFFANVINTAMESPLNFIMSRRSMKFVEVLALFDAVAKKVMRGRYMPSEMSDALDMAANKWRWRRTSVDQCVWGGAGKNESGWEDEGNVGWKYIIM